MIKAFRVRLTGKQGASQDLLACVRSDDRLIWTVDTMAEFCRIQNGLAAALKGRGKAVEIEFLSCFNETMVFSGKDLLKPRKRKSPRRKKAASILAATAEDLLWARRLGRKK